MSHPSIASSENHERTLRVFRPAPVSVAVGPMAFWVVVVVAAIVGSGTHTQWDQPGTWWPLMAALLVGLAGMRLVWEVLNWWCTRYELTTTRVTCRFGVVSRISVEIPVHRIQNVTVVRRLRDRLVGIGSIGIDSAGTNRTEVWWVMIADPEALAREVRSVIPLPSAAVPTTTPPPNNPSALRPIVIGLTGSIGAGKSTAAKMFGELGCVVIDSDAESRAAIDRPEIRETLVGWWGDRVLSPDGHIDRKAVGTIVFANPDERRRLERLIHPLVRRSRAEFLERAKPDDLGRAPLVVIDVPLLFEAGVDAECDLVVYIDAPREVRLARVASRGWDDAELARREAAQMPIPEKKARADERLENAGDLHTLRRDIAAVADRARSRPRRRPTTL